MQYRVADWTVFHPFEFLIEILLPQPDGIKQPPVTITDARNHMQHPLSPLAFSDPHALRPINLNSSQRM
jgi:hypothetical protein